MAELREVIIGNIRLTIAAGSSPRDRQIMMLGEATIYDQNQNPTRTYSGDLTSKMTPDDQIVCAGLIDRFIQSLMVEHDISQSDLNEGQAILDAATPEPQIGAMPAPQPGAPGPIPTPVPQTLSVNGGGTLAEAPTQAPEEPVSTEEGEGTLRIPPEQS
jgi:hypothetical protein